MELRCAASRTGLLACAMLMSASLMADDGDSKLIRPTVQVTVKATGNGPLHYRWRSSDGHIRDVDAPKTSWTLPSGPGLHFAYVLVNDRKGGYSEARVVVSTDDVGGVPESDALAPRPLVAPPGPAPAGADFYRSFFYIDRTPFNSNYAATPGVQIYATDNASSNRYPPSGVVWTGPDGSFTLPDVPYSTNSTSSTFTFHCSFDGGQNFSDCGTDTMLTNAAYTDYFGAFHGGPSVSGHILLADNSPCGVDNDLFDVHRTGNVTILDGNHKVLATAKTDAFGDWGVPIDPSLTPVSVRLRCESVTTSVLLGPPAGSNITVVPDMTFPAGTGAPDIKDMRAPLNGRPGLFQAEPSRSLPPIPPGGMPIALAGWQGLVPTRFPSDFVTRSNSFLAFKGHDSRASGCQYYLSIGAVQGCRPDGSFIKPISYEDWKRTVKIEKYAVPGGVTASSAYVNKVDLNLTRVQESIRYGTDSLAAVVCNHLGPNVTDPNSFVNPGAAVDTAVGDAIAGRNLVACVAMDYAVQPGVNGNSKFVRFYIFGPSGQLLPSVNLDLRGEKFVPGSCVPCHGGEHYAGAFPSDGTPLADFGGHMLPYDKGNFEFSSVDGLTDAQRESAIYALNQNLLNADPVVNPPVVEGALTLAGQSLISGWYSNSSLPPQTLDPNYLPASWVTEVAAEKAATTGSPNGYTDPGVDHATPFYQRVLARTCRTCHVNQIEPYNFDNQLNTLKNGNAVLADAGDEFTRSTCGNTSYRWRGLTMPNSQVTFNRFWLSQGSADSSGSTDMPQLMFDYFRDLGDFGYFTPHCADPPSIVP